MPVDRNLLRMLGAIAIGYAFLLAALLTWRFLLGPPYEAPTLVGLLGTSLCIAMVGLLTFAAAMAGLHWPKRAAALIAGTAAISALLVNLFEWPAFFLWQFLIELIVQMIFQLTVLIVAQQSGYGFLTLNAMTETRSTDSAKNSQISLRDIFLLVTSCALLFAALRPLQPSNQPWFSSALAILIACGVLCGTVGLMTIWGALSNAHVALRCLALVFPAPLAAGGYLVARHFDPWLLYDALWYAYSALIVMLFMLMPLLILRWHGYRCVRTRIAQPQVATT
jgi:hypothetical protein